MRKASSRSSILRTCAGACSCERAADRALLRWLLIPLRPPINDSDSGCGSSGVEKKHAAAGDGQCSTPHTQSCFLTSKLVAQPGGLRAGRLAAFTAWMPGCLTALLPGWQACCLCCLHARSLRAGGKLRRSLLRLVNLRLPKIERGGAEEVQTKRTNRCSTFKLWAHLGARVAWHGMEPKSTKRTDHFSAIHSGWVACGQERG